MSITLLEKSEYSASQGKYGMVYLIRRNFTQQNNNKKRRKKDSSGLLLYVWKRRLRNDTRDKNLSLGPPCFE
jgi:hypothetical protein